MIDVRWQPQGQHPQHEPTDVYANGMAGQPGVVQEVGAQQAGHSQNKGDGRKRRRNVLISLRPGSRQPHAQETAQQGQYQCGSQQSPLGFWTMYPVQFRADSHWVSHLLHGQALRLLRGSSLLQKSVPLVRQVLFQLSGHRRTGPLPPDLLLHHIQILTDGFSLGRRLLSAPGPRHGHRRSRTPPSPAGRRSPLLSGDNTAVAFPPQLPSRRR